MPGLLQNPIKDSSVSQLSRPFSAHPNMAGEATPKALTFEEGWPFLQEAINKLIDIVDGVRSDQFNSEEYMQIYTTAYNICYPNPVGPECQKLYDQYKKTIEDYTSSKVLPYLREKKDEDLLQELVKRWKNLKVMMRWLSRFLHYLDRYFIRRKKLPSLNATSLLIFYELVHGEMNDQVRDSVISMIHREREGEPIDQALVKNVLDIYVEIGEGSMKYYVKDFEEAMLIDTTSFYSHKASIWIASESYKDYMVKVEESLKHEKDRVSCYLQQKSQYKLLEVLLASKPSANISC
ncbi:cullin-1-like isoform X2 [Actinidia eriantha]|uniref:cullin-1-like isoform X2 n=1 Tax=Actinidia eriantha TaxID=165200 RepID=UPI00258F19D0|nr:cullin-1-like isoform X2 [Actinidia eriantha]